MPLSLEVTFAAYLAVLLGTFVPVTFLIVLYSQVEFTSNFSATDNITTKHHYKNTFFTIMNRARHARPVYVRERPSKSCANDLMLLD
jgi:hypothetical protein